MGCPVGICSAPHILSGQGLPAMAAGEPHVLASVPPNTSFPSALRPAARGESVKWGSRCLGGLLLQVCLIRKKVTFP